MKTNGIATKATAVVLSVAALFSGGCTSLKNTWDGMSQAGQGATAGGAAGAAIGTGVGALIGGGRGTWIGALVGGALGAGTGALIGNHMDRQKKALEEQFAQMQSQIDDNTAKADSNAQAIRDIKIESVKDSNNLEAIKLVLGNSVLFRTNSSSLSAAADAALSRVAYNLKQFPNTDVTIVGYTDNTGTQAINDKLSLERAQSVMTYLESQGIPAARMKALGDGWNNPIASNSTAEGRAQNRRVEIFITADKQMIQNAEQQSR